MIQKRPHQAVSGMAHMAHMVAAGVPVKMYLCKGGGQKGVHKGLQGEKGQRGTEKCGMFKRQKPTRPQGRKKKTTTTKCVCWGGLGV